MIHDVQDNSLFHIPQNTSITIMTPHLDNESHTNPALKTVINLWWAEVRFLVVFALLANGKSLQFIPTKQLNLFKKFKINFRQQSVLDCKIFVMTTSLQKYNYVKTIFFVNFSKLCFKIQKPTYSKSSFWYKKLSGEVCMKNLIKYICFRGNPSWR